MLSRQVTPRFAARVDRTGNLHLVDRHGFARHVRTFAGRDVDVIVRHPKRHRSDRQNRFYWSVVIGLTAEHCGYLPEEMHDAWKLRLLRREDPDHPMPTLRSTADLTTQEFEDYIAQIRIIAATELDVQIPEPNEQALGSPQDDEDAETTRASGNETIAQGRPAERDGDGIRRHRRGDQISSGYRLQTASEAFKGARELFRIGILP